MESISTTECSSAGRARRSGRRGRRFKSDHSDKHKKSLHGINQEGCIRNKKSSLTRLPLILRQRVLILPVNSGSSVRYCVRHVGEQLPTLDFHRCAPLAKLVISMLPSHSGQFLSCKVLIIIISYFEAKIKYYRVYNLISQLQNTKSPPFSLECSQGARRNSKHLNTHFRGQTKK